MSAPPLVHVIADGAGGLKRAQPLALALAAAGGCAPRLVVLGTVEPGAADHVLEIDGATATERAAAALVAYEGLCLAERPAWTVVAGCGDIAMACTVAAKKLWLPVAHLGAGRCDGGDVVNAPTIDVLADLLWTAGAEDEQALRRDGVAGRIERIGDEDAGALARAAASLRRELRA